LCLLCLVVYVYFVVFDCVFFYALSTLLWLCLLVIGWEDYTLVIHVSFVLKGFLYKDHIEELFIVNILIVVFTTRDICQFLINFTFLTASYFSKT